MIRASIHVRGKGGGSTGYLTDLAELPRPGDEILMHDYEGENEVRGRVTLVRHLLAYSADYRAGSQLIEVMVDGEV